MSEIEDFVSARLQAERIARHQSSAEDVSLKQIWYVLTSNLGWVTDTSLLQCELNAEEAVISPVTSTREHVQNERRAGSRVIFISDMYLPAEFILRQLVRHGFAEPGDGIYVSGDLGLTKTSGHLFEHVLAQEGVVPGDVVHVGDNPVGDVAAPAKLGISTRLAGDARLTSHEEGVLKAVRDLEAASRVAGTMRAVRLSGAVGRTSGLDQLVSQFAGPFVLGFATWVLSKASEKGIRRLYFLSRDCQMVCKVAGELASQFGGIECRYLHVSRQALYLPSTESITPEGMPWMKRQGVERPILMNLLGKVELRFEEAGEAFRELAKDQGKEHALEGESEWEAFWRVLNSEPLKSRIEQTIQTRRKAALAYFQAEGLFEDVPWAVVDLGWFLTCQQAIWRTLGGAGWTKTIEGIYLALKSQRCSAVAAGRSCALIHEPPPDAPSVLKSNVMFRYQTLIEHIIGCADHPTVHHYALSGSGKASPVYQGSIGEEHKAFCDELHAAVLEYARMHLQDDRRIASDESCRELVLELTENFFLSPPYEAVHAMSSLSLSMDQNNHQSAPLARPLNWRMALLPLFPRRPPFNKLWESWEYPNHHWPEGSLVITPEPVRSAARFAMRLAAIRSGFINAVRKELGAA